jgi:GT2 family glycosyltransferase
LATDAPELSVILVSYNTRAMTLRCLDALYVSLEGVSAEVWVVDNASADGTCEAVMARWPDVRLIANAENRGFGAANNQAMEQAEGRHILLLNTDAFVEPDAVHQLLAFMSAHPDVGVAGPKLLNADGSHQPSAHQFDTPWHAWEQYLGLARFLRRGVAMPAMSGCCLLEGFYLKGACLLIRRAVYERIGGFDERFFFYGDEADWQKRMVDVGERIACTDTSEVTHLVGHSGSSDRLCFTMHYYIARDQYMRKHFGVVGWLAYRVAVFLWCVRKLTRQLCWWLQPGRVVDPFAWRLHVFLVWTLLSSPRRMRSALESTLSGVRAESGPEPVAAVGEGCDPTA